MKTQILRSILLLFAVTLFQAVATAQEQQSDKVKMSDRKSSKRCSRLYSSGLINSTEHTQCQVMLSRLMPGAESALFKTPKDAELRLPEISDNDPYILWLDKIEGL